jgi:phosphatidylglycerophosphate synthase
MKPESASTPEPELLRRPIQARNTKWAARIGQALARSGLRPNYISTLSMVFGGLAGASLLFARPDASLKAKVLLFLCAAACMQLRLLCNLFDGMVAIEGGFKTKSGEVFNELPDRISDIAIFLGAGYAAPELHELGWAAALLSVLTAYVRAFGGAAGAKQFFGGPMAKQQRMAVMTAACLAAAGLAPAGSRFQIMPFALWIVAIGCGITIARRTWLIVQDLEAR